MTIRNALNGVVRTTYLGVIFPFRAAGGALYRGARGIVLGINRALVAIGHGIVGGVRGTGDAFFAASRFVIRGISNTLHGIAGGILSIGQAILSFLHWTRTMIAVVAIKTAHLAAMPFIAIYRATGRFGSGIVSFFKAKYRAMALRLAPTAMTLSFEDGRAQLLVLKRGRVIAWRSGPIAQPPEETEADPADTTGSGKKDEQPAFNPLGSLLGELPTRSRRVIADLPLHVPLLRHVPVPDVKRKFIKGIVNNEVLDSVPFDADEVDIRWRIKPGENINEASVIAIPRDRMDEQASIVRESQLAQSAVYPKASALAAAVARPDVFILHMTKDQTAVILVRSGIPRIVHRIDLPKDIVEQVDAIAMGVGQVAGYHRSQRPDDDVAGLPVVVTGEVKQVQDLVNLLATTLDRPVLPFETDLEYPENFDPTEYASNIGLFLAANSKESAKGISAQNVLPERHIPWRFPVAAIAVFTGLIALGFVSFQVTGLVSDKAAELDPLNAKLTVMENQAREYRLTAAKRRVIDQRIVASDLEALELEANLLLLEQEMETLLSRISDITGNAWQSDVELSQFAPVVDGYSVTGRAASYSDVLGYAASMRSSPNFENAVVVQVSDSNASEVRFTVVVTIPTPDSEEDGASGP